MTSTLTTDYSTDTHCVSICPVGDHLRVARAWRTTCQTCGQTIPTGNIGAVTWDDDLVCGKGSHSHQHGCGAWNWPEEVTIDLTEDSDIDDAVAEGIAAVDELIDAEQADGATAIEARLRVDLADALARRADLAAMFPDMDAEELDEAITTGSDTGPGVYLDEQDGWVAWDYDPRSDGDPLTVYS